MHGFARPEQNVLLFFYPYKRILQLRNTCEINEIPRPSYDEGYLGYLKSSPISDSCWEVGSGEEFSCNMYWLPLN